MSSASRLRLLVTGGAGFIGSHFVELALQKGHHVTILDAFTYAGRRENLVQCLASPNCRLVEGNITNFGLVLELLQQDSIQCIVHFAAESHVDRSIHGPDLFVETNIVGTFQLLKAAFQYWQSLPSSAQNVFRYLQVSTDEVYGSLGSSGKFHEATPYAPNSPYSASKAAADHLVRAWHHTYGLPTLTTHCSNNYGPRQFPEKLIPTLITRALRDEPLPVYGDGKHIRDWIHVLDHCRGVLLALERGIPGETYCFGGNAEKSNLEVAQSICKILDELKPRTDGKAHETRITFVQDRLGHDRRYAIDDHRAQNELGFQRLFDFQTGLKETLKWYLENS